MKKLFAMILTIVTAAACCFGFTACSDKKEETLKVGITDYKPMDYKENGSDEWIGFDADLAREVGKILGKKVEFVEINWDNKVFSLNSKEIDVIWNGMTITDELKQNILISDAYLDNKQVVVCQKSEAEKYKTIADVLKASEILVEAGSAGDSAISAVEGLKAGQLKTASAQKDTLLEVKTSASKIAVIDKLMAQVVTGDGTSYSDLTFVDVGFELEQFGIGFRKDDTALKTDVENAIKQLKDNGKYAEIQTKYFG